MYVSTVAIFEKSLGDLALTDNLRGLIHTLPTGHRCGSRLSFVESITRQRSLLVVILQAVSGRCLQRSSNGCTLLISNRLILPRLRHARHRFRRASSKVHNRRDQSAMSLQPGDQMSSTFSIPSLHLMARIDALPPSMSCEGEYLVFAYTHRIRRKLSTSRVRNRHIHDRSM